MAYDSDSTKPIGSIKEAWESAKLRAALILQGGWSTATMVRMAARFGHFTLNELRDAVECIIAPIHAGPR